MADQKNQALTAALGQIEKAFGKGAIMRMGDETKIPVAAISTGSLSLDLALGVGGVPRGRIVRGRCKTASPAGVEETRWQIRRIRR